MAIDQKDEWLKQMTVLLLAAAPLNQAAVALTQVQPDWQADFLNRLAALEVNWAKTANWLEPMYQINPLVLIGELRQAEDGAKAGAAVYEYVGRRKAAQLLMTMPSDTAQQVYERLIAVNRELAVTLAEDVFFFNEIDGLPDRWIQALLREMAGKRLGMPELALALEDVAATLREKILRNLSTHQAANLRQELSYLQRPIDEDKRQEAKREVTRVAVSMVKNGEIRILRAWISPVVRKDTWDALDANVRDGLAKIIDGLRGWSDQQLHGLPMAMGGTRLARALLAASPDVKERVIACQTERGGQILRDELENALEKGLYLSELAAAVQQVATPIREKV